ncbi:MAG: class II fructose-bisphosphate aldolase [Halanaerobiales bacterium]|nr:class II fructose-bisphosphate aldolase [Halanaerobiales bacterium]
MLVKSIKELYQNLPAGVYAIGAFNVHNMEFVQGVISAAEKEKAPVILMIGEPIARYAGLAMLVEICQYAARNASIPVAITLDHGKSLAMIYQSIELGISVMYDGSDLPLEKNIAIIKEIAAEAHKKGLVVEGELGRVGGSEDEEETVKQFLTDPKIASDFVAETGVDLLAVAIGNCHGLYRGKPQLDIGRLQAIKRNVDIPIVLHGGSNLPIDQAKLAIENGINKFNISTDLKIAFAKRLKTELEYDPLPYHPPIILGPARQEVEKIARNKIRLFGSSDKALAYQVIGSEMTAG